MFIDQPLPRRADFQTYFQNWFPGDTPEDCLIAYNSADPEALGKVLATILDGWHQQNPVIPAFEAEEIEYWYRYMPHEMIESIIAKLLLDAGLIVHCGAHFIEAYQPTDAEMAFVKGMMQTLSSGNCTQPPAKVLIEVTGGICEWESLGNVKVHVCDYDNDPDEIIPAEFQNLADQKQDGTSPMDLSRLFFDELLSNYETLTGIADQYGSRTLADLMYLHSAIMHGGFIDSYEDESSVLEIVKGLESADKWISYIKIEYLTQ